MGLTDLKWWVVALCTGREGGPTGRLLTLPTMLPGPAYLPCLHHARCCQSFAGAVHRMESGIAVPVIVKCGVPHCARTTGIRGLARTRPPLLWQTHAQRPRWGPAPPAAPPWLPQLQAAAL